MIRLFVALIIPEYVKDKIIENCDKVIGKLSGYKWEAKDKIHLTLKFIGDVEDNLLQEIMNELNFVTDYSSFNCIISKFCFFFRNSEAKILWCDLKTDERINNLVNQLNEKLSKFDIEVEKRKFKGHLTLLRIKNRVNEEFIKKFKEFDFNPIHLNSNQIALIQSILKPSGSEYKVLKIYVLK